ncbi:MAG: TatD family hydrolase [Desulfurococcus sp.]|nr:TatD family hydrolase [Desulfurococcus sp.]
MIVDMHIHCHEISEDILTGYLGKYILVCVSDDPESSRRTLELRERYEGVEPCVGVHPWVADNYGVDELKTLVEEAVRRDVRCLGEVGLDKRFTAGTFNKQLELFRVIVDYAREYELVLNLHAAGAWREVFNEVYKRDIEKAYFHWYTGPTDVLNSIIEAGYYIGLNPAWRIQAKHRDIISLSPLDNILTESDAPYEYHGLKLTPEMIPESIKLLASMLEKSTSEVEEAVWRNYMKIFS